MRQFHEFSKSNYWQVFALCLDGAGACRLQKLVSYPKAVGLLALLPNLEFFLFALGTKADLPTIEPFSSYHAASDNDRKTAQQSLGSIISDIIPKPQKIVLSLELVLRSEEWAISQKNIV